MRGNTRARTRTLVLGIALLFLAGCSSRPAGYQMVHPTPIDQAPADTPEDQLLDVGVAIASPQELRPNQQKKLGTNEDIRQSEAHFIPYHLRNTMQDSGHWGSVWVLPDSAEAVELRVTSELVGSNGEILQLIVQATDATGAVWFRNKYHAEVITTDYARATAPGDRDVFQHMYNTIANDLAAFKRSLTPEDIERIRTVARLEFARLMSPDMFQDHLGEDESGRTVVYRLPADNDPQMARVERIRERENMFRDTLNQYYEGFYLDMWEAYENWREYNLAEIDALRTAEKEAFFRTLTGAAMIAGAIALGAQDSSLSDFGSGVLLAGGGQILIDGINISAQKEIHAAAIQELGESFGTEMRPTVLELEGKQYELTGTVSEQYEQWQNLLRRIYFEETGFDPDFERFGDDATNPGV